MAARDPGAHVTPPEPRGNDPRPAEGTRQQGLLERVRGLAVVATMLFYTYLVGRIVVTAPILNSTLREELRPHDPSRRAEPHAGPPAMTE